MYIPSYISYKTTLNARQKSFNRQFIHLLAVKVKVVMTLRSFKLSFPLGLKYFSTVCNEIIPCLESDLIVVSFSFGTDYLREFILRFLQKFSCIIYISIDVLVKP